MQKGSHRRGAESVEEITELAEWPRITLMGTDGKRVVLIWN
jgi:hypothetical protein